MHTYSGSEKLSIPNCWTSHSSTTWFRLPSLNKNARSYLCPWPSAGGVLIANPPSLLATMLMRLHSRQDRSCCGPHLGRMNVLSHSSFPMFSHCAASLSDAQRYVGLRTDLGNISPRET